MVEYVGFSALGFERSDLCFGNGEERIQKAFLACVEGSQSILDCLFFFFFLGGGGGGGAEYSRISNPKP